MKQFLSLVVVAFGISPSAFATPRTLDCLTDSHGGIVLHFTVIETRPPSEEGYDGLFEGAGVGRVEVEPLSPLKIQFPTRFEVVSQPSKRYSMDIRQAQLGHPSPFVFRLGSLPHGATKFPATIRYGRHELVHQATCEFR